MRSHVASLEVTKGLRWCRFARLGWLATVMVFMLLPCPMRAVAQPMTPSVRLRYTINEQWRYAPAPVADAATTDFNDSAWATVALPHTWNAEDAFDKEEGFRRGVGWYRKRLMLNPALREKKLFLYFEGANQVADVFVNGEPVGQHVGGYTAFVFDVTDLLAFDRPNVVAVRVDNRHDDDIPPLDADFTSYGGLYRDVWFMATEMIHLDVLDHAAPGVFIDTPEVSDEAATIRVRGHVTNETGRDALVDVVHRVFDARNRERAVLLTDFSIAAGTSTGFDVSTRIEKPHLWSPDDPYLYRVVTEVYDEADLVDQIENPLGFRWFRVDAQEGFFLNGAPLRLFGTNRHQDGPGYGNALPNSAHRRDVRLVKETGFNFLRLAHYPQDPVVLDAADRLGLVVWEETPVVNTITLSDAFAEHAERMLVEMIRQHYNHPSVLMWGYMNEIMLREPNPRPEGYRDAILALARRLEARVKAEDSTRATVSAISFDEVDNGTGFQDIPDILGMNLYFGWYYHDFETLASFLDDLHARHPNRPLFVSEYGAGSDERVHTTAPVRFDFSSEHAQDYHRANFAVMEARPYLAGTAVWNQFDFGSALRQDTKNAINQKGLFFFDRAPKDIAFYYQAKLKDKPVLHIAREWVRRAGSRPEDRTQPIWVYANTEAVELFVNGVSHGAKPVENATARWAVDFRPGVNRIEARGLWNGEPVEDVVEMHYEDRRAFFTDPGAAVNVVAVNAGAHYAYVDAFGVVWEADRAYEPGSWGHAGGTLHRTHHRMHGTPDDPLFQATREGAQTYRFDVPDGAYVVELGFIETAHEAPGERVFDVWVNAQVAFTALDLAAAYGRWVAVSRTVETQVRLNQGLAIVFEAEVGTPTISSILVRRR